MVQWNLQQWALPITETSTMQSRFIPDTLLYIVASV